MDSRWVVRWWLNDTDAEKFSLMIEQLRYAGIIRTWSKGGLPKIIDLYAPFGVEDTKFWAEQKSGRMGSFMLVTRAVEKSSSPYEFCPECGETGSNTSKYPVTGCENCEGDGSILVDSNPFDLLNWERLLDLELATRGFLFKGFMLREANRKAIVEALKCKAKDPVQLKILDQLREKGHIE